MKAVTCYFCNKYDTLWATPKECRICEDSHDESVPVWEAIRELQNGRTVVWKLGAEEMVFRPDGAWFITKTNIDFGKWYIKEGER